MSRPKLTLSFLLLCTPLLATNSLMFSKKEQADILLKRIQIHQDNLKNKEDCLECNGILFQGASNWSAWINGQKFEASAPDCPHQNLKIFAVEKNKVHLEWKHKGKKHIVILSPNQYYNARLAKVITPHNSP